MKAVAPEYDDNSVDVCLPPLPHCSDFFTFFPPLRVYPVSDSYLSSCFSLVLPPPALLLFFNEVLTPRCLPNLRGAEKVGGKEKGE